LEETILVDATNAFDVHRKAIADFGSKATSSEIVAELVTLAHEDGHAPISSCANV
jgi:predicted dinucleotide-binding enzyme